jgi:hypothetical protein
VKHNFKILIIKICGICESCQQYIETRKAFTTAEMQQYRNNPKALREFKLELSYDELDKHECKP